MTLPELGQIFRSGLNDQCRKTDFLPISPKKFPSFPISVCEGVNGKQNIGRFELLMLFPRKFVIVGNYQLVFGMIPKTWRGKGVFFTAQ